ncbi:TAP-like protein [Teratosphaeria destructans]|uniref:TAP-like protein n=1 Tax=Teratosphaeria destructans TaxID=418781 RepID=A0A9W7SXF4_9PEZI|nr:TAP-like protein [Teratosphaeria destructans]
MDWLGDSAEANQTVQLALIKVEATVPITDPTYGGAVVLNPGGPGGSGIDQVLRGGHHVRTIVSAGPDADHATARNFDIIGFDPRGVNNTTPFLSCAPNHLEAARQAIEEDAHGFIDSSDTAFDYIWARKRAWADDCSRRAAAQGIGKHVSTAPVARDIIEIVERHGEWREQEVQRQLSRDNSLTEADKEAIIDRTAYHPLDGVSDSHDYMAAGWTTNLRDTDLTFVKLAEHCWDGGKDHCALWHEDGPAAITETVQATIQDLKDDPIGVASDGHYGPTAVTHADLMKLIRDIVYWPLADFPLTVQILHDLRNRNGTSLRAWTRSQQPPLGEPLSKTCLQDGPYSAACLRGATPSANAAIACSDGWPHRLDEPRERYRRYADRLTAASRLIGASWASIMMPCTAWHARPHWRYDGDFRDGTAHPILFVGNTVDPVTPLSNAFTMARGFEGAGVLHQDSEGHCSYSGLSLCTARAVRAYFQSGVLPGEVGALREVDGWEGWGELCAVDRKPLDGYTRDGVVPLPEGERDRELWEAMVGLNRGWP